MSLTVPIKARVEQQSEFDQASQSYWTNVREPSPDGFSGGSSYRVKSGQPLGQAGSDVNFKMQIKNFVRTESFRDKNTGQPRTISKNQCSFECVELIQGK